MGYAERIYEQVKHLPEQAAKEVLDFTELVVTRQKQKTSTVSEEERQRRRAEVAKMFAEYQFDLSNFKFDREEANARR
jgi:hypothetical protein